MKKLLSTILATFVVVATLGFSTTVEAADKMTSTIDTFLGGIHYDYKKGSVSISDVQTIKLDKPINGMKEMKIGVAEFQTIRDGMFITNQKDFVYFDPAKNKALTLQEVATVKDVQTYRDAHKGLPTKSVAVGPILLLLSLLLLVPGYFMYIWGSRQYSTTAFKNANNLYKNDASFS